MSIQDLAWSYAEGLFSTHSREGTQFSKQHDLVQWVGGCNEPGRAREAGAAISGV